MFNSELNSNLGNQTYQFYRSNLETYSVIDTSKAKTLKITQRMYAYEGATITNRIFPYTESTSSWLPNPTDGVSGGISLGGNYHADDAIYTQAHTGTTTTTYEGEVDVSEYDYVFFSHVNNNTMAYYIDSVVIELQ